MFYTNYYFSDQPKSFRIHNLRSLFSLWRYW